MRYPVDAKAITVFTASGKADRVMAYDEKGNKTDKPAVDEQGRGLWTLTNALLKIGDVISTEDKIRVKAVPAKLEVMRPYRLVGEVMLSVWKGRVTITADGMEAI